MTRLLLTLPIVLALASAACPGPVPAGSPATAPAEPGSAPAPAGSEASAASTEAPSDAEASGASAPAAPVVAQNPIAQPPAAGSGAAPVAESVLYASDLVSLRANHPVRNEGATCMNDGDCESPLRCVLQSCTFPPAMTGFRTPDSPTVTFQTADGASTYVVELALTPPEQQRGLMHRRTMVADAGMIFVFPDERPRSFWMRNTLIPLDMVFVRADGVVDSIIVGAEPLTESPRPSTGPARFVIELNAGETVSIGLRPGDRMISANVPL
jgi:uncharacterized membrane protein (UPF0127 family)